MNNENIDVKAPNVTDATVERRTHVSFTFNNKKYYFEVEKELHREGSAKRIYIGCFRRSGNGSIPNDSLPTGTEYDKEYCLKTAYVTLPLSISHPQNRHFWDFFPFKGDNLREVIALNDDAFQMSQELKNGGIKPYDTNADPDSLRNFDCAVLEPVYSPFRIEDFPTYFDKIDCMLQIIKGLKQLMGDETLREYRVIAHRDMKFNNVVVQHCEDGTRRIRLIDFPTVKFNFPDTQGNDNHTYLGFVSLSNTAPEDVIANYRVSAKTDVFALGAMLAEIFGVWSYDGVNNPLRLLFDCVPYIRTDIAEDCRIFYTKMNELYPYSGADGYSWLESALNANEKNAVWDNIDNSLRIWIRTLFRRAVVINPGRRISLDVFESELKKINKQIQTYQNDYSKVGNDHRISYLLLDTSNIKSYVHIYSDVINDIINQNKGCKLYVMPYGAYHSSKVLTANPDSPDIFDITGENVMVKLSKLQESEHSEVHLNGLKGAMFDLSSYLKNGTVQHSFSGDIHVIAPEFPNEGNMCCFETRSIDLLGQLTSRLLNAVDIVEQLDGCNNIYVHSFREQGSSTENWYIPVFINANNPVTLENEPVKSSQSEETPAVQETEVLRSGRGFHFIGGTIITRKI
ncbi:MAG: hypothetical protein E7591_04530 [Ruminococcaceae bacterium]|nr:hypothetical protein [Oscillospiraceae bacterium]